MNGTPKDIDPASHLREEDDEQALPEPEPEAPAGTLAAGRAAIARAVKQAPPRPGVYRMIDAQGEVLYVGKAKNIKKRVTAYTRPAGHDSRIMRMISGSAAMEFVTTKTETEALLLEANLIKRLRPRFNVLLRDDKSFPFILITSDHWAPQILKHRGARTQRGHYYGPFANAGAVNRTINALQRAFLLRSCSESFFEARTRPCLLYQIKRCSAPCTQEIDFAGYGELVREANEFLSGRSRAVQKAMAAEMDTASNALDFERAAIYRDRLAALSAITSHQGINPRTLEEADVFAVHQAGGYTCVEVFFFRTGQNWGNRAYFPKADRSLGAGEVLSAFLAQFYDDKSPPKLVLASHAFDERALLAQALTTKNGRKVEVAVPQRGERKDLVQHALANAREALARKLADTSSQQKLLKALTGTFALPRSPRRIEVYDNSHIGGSNAVGAMVVAGPEGFRKNQYRKFNIRSQEIQTRRRLRHVARGVAAAVQAIAGREPAPDGRCRARRRAHRRAGGGRRATLARPRVDRRRAGAALSGGRDARRHGRHRRAAGRHRQGAGPRRRARDLLHGGPQPVQAAAARSSFSISSSGCATRRTASPSVRTARGARRTSARPACRKSRGSGPPASGPCCAISAP